MHMWCSYHSCSKGLGLWSSPSMGWMVVHMYLGKKRHLAVIPYILTKSKKLVLKILISAISLDHVPTLHILLLYIKADLLITQWHNFIINRLINYSIPFLHFLAHTLNQSITCIKPVAVTHLLTNPPSLTHSFTHPPAKSLDHFLTHSLSTHSLQTHYLIHSLPIQSLTQSINHTVTFT